MQAPSLDVVRFGPYEIRPPTRELFKHGIRVKLPPQAFQVLRLLLERKGELVTRQEFHHALWLADTFVDFDQGLNNAIKRIREVLNDSAEAPRYIETLPRLGYRFIGKVEWPQQEFLDSSGSIDQQSPAAILQTSEAAAGGEPNSQIPATVPRQKLSSRSLLVPPAIALLVIAWFYRPYYPAPRITSEVQLTADGIPKWGPLATDGLRVYFTETVKGHSTVAAVPISGGQAVALKMPFEQAGLYGISPDKADLLVAESRDMLQEAPLWRVPVIGGTPRRLGNIVSHDANWSPDGKKLAYANRSGLYIANADGSDPKTLLAPKSDPSLWAWRPTWSQDGRRLRFDYYNMNTHESKIWEVNMDGTNPHPLFAASPDWLMQACSDWSPDGKYFLFSSWKDLESGMPWPAANLWAVREKAELFHRASPTPANLTTGPIRYFLHVPSLDGKTIFALSSLKHGELMRYEVMTKAVVPYGSGLSAEGATFSRNGWMAYIKYPQGELWRSRPDGKEPLQLTFRPLFAMLPSWSPDGKQIAFCGQRAGENWQLYLVSIEGGEPRPLLQAKGAFSASWSGDGTSLAFGDTNGAIRIISLKTGAVSTLASSENLWLPSWSPDGTYIAANTSGGQLMLFSFKTQKWSVKLPGRYRVASVVVGWQMAILRQGGR